MYNLELDIFLHWLNDRRFLVLNFFWLLIPSMTMWLLDDWFDILNREARAVLQRARFFILVALIPHGYFHVAQIWEFDLNTTEWKTHMLASLFTLLFVVMVAFNYQESLGIKKCIWMSYLAASVSFLTLLAEGTAELDAVMRVLFIGGILFFLIGLIIIGILVYRKERLHLPICNR